MLRDDERMLGVLGLTFAEEQLYEWLLERSPVSVSDLDERLAGRPWAAERTMLLARLEDLGLAVWVPGDPPSWHTVPPDIALDPLAFECERALADARRWCSRLTAAFRVPQPSTDPVRLVEILRGRRAIGERIKVVLREARREVRCFDAPPYLGRPPQLYTLERDQLRPGIRYRVLYDRQGLELPGRLSDLDIGQAVGEQARVTDVAVKLILSDSSVALLPLQHEPGEIETSLVVHDSVLLEALSALFEMCWVRALPLPLRNGRPQLPDAAGEGPTAVDRDLLTMLAAGFTDLAIAERLGCNERTVRRRVKHLMCRLDAVTRFQAGYQAIRRGWLTIRDAA